MKKLINLWPSIKHKNKINIKIFYIITIKRLKLTLIEAI